MLTDPTSPDFSFLLGHGTPLSGFGNQPSTAMRDKAKITSLEQKLEVMEKEFTQKLEMLEQEIENLK